MTNKLLGIIAINLTIITGLMVLQSIPTATAQSSITKVALCNQYGTECATIHRNTRSDDNGQRFFYPAGLVSGSIASIPER